MKISVVMSVFDGAAHLAETVESILSQSVRDFELVMVDDGSRDATPEILRAFAARDSRIRILTQENAGLTRALIRGCSAARGDFIARHDVGDLSHPRRLETQERMLDQNGEVVFVSCATQYVGPELEPLWITRPSPATLEPASIIDLSREHGITAGPSHHGSVMFRREAYESVGGYRAAFYYGQDFDLWYRLAELGQFQAAAEVLYTARITPESISGLARGQQKRLAKLSRAALDARQHGQPEDPILAAAAIVGPVRGRASRSARAAGLYFIGEALRRNRDPRARTYLRRAIANWPFHPRAWVRMIQALLT